MKIGIMTFWWSNDNYGQLLQCYALQQYLREQGHEPFLIRYDSRPDFLPPPVWRKVIKAFNPIKLSRFIKYKFIKKFQKIQFNLEEQNNQRQFDSFRKKYIRQSEQIYLSYSELKENPPKADCYIVGSDQVWNFYEYPLNKCKNPLHAYFLDFGASSTKRISYSASWGKTEISDEYKNEIQPLLSKFNYISVRERTGVSLCQACGAKKVELRCDPTLLLKADHYRQLYLTEKNPDFPERYILVYRLGNPCDFPMKKISNWANSKSLEVIYVTANGLSDTYKKIYPTIQQWLSLIDNAEYVITNSFHCCVFSLIFRRKFAVIPLKSSAKGMNSRIETLFELFKVTPRWLEKDNFSILEQPLGEISAQEFSFEIEEVSNNISVGL